MAILIFLLLPLLIFASENEEIADQSDVQRTLHCVRAVREVVISNTEGEANANIADQLKQLTPVGEYLKAKAQTCVTEMESVEKKYNEELHLTNADVQNLKTTKSNLEGKKTELENKYSAKMEKLKVARKKLTKLKDKLDAASRKLQLAKRRKEEEKNASPEKERVKKRRAEKRRLLMGFKELKLSGFKTSAFDSELISQTEKEIRDTKGQVFKANQRVESIFADFAAMKEDLKKADDGIQWHETRIKELQQEVGKSRNKIASAQGLVMLLKESSRFWDLFTQAAGASERPDEQLKEMNAMLSEEDGACNILCNDGSITHARSFIDVWVVLISSDKLKTQFC